MPLDSRPMTGIAKGVFELRDSDASSWYRVVYYTKIKGVIHVLHSFTKKSRKTPKEEIATATKRLKEVKQEALKTKKGRAK